MASHILADLVFEQVNDIVKFQLGTEFHEGMCLRTYRRDNKYGSPLEIVFDLWFHAIQETGREPEPFTLLSQQDVQTPAGKAYRLDFQVVSHIGFDAMTLPLVVELDGHAFHEKTREQVEARNARDRALQQMGFLVFHFSFAEVMQAPYRCVDEVLRAAWKMRLEQHLPRG